MSCSDVKKHIYMYSQYRNLPDAICDGGESVT